MYPTIYSTRNHNFIPTLFNELFKDDWMPMHQFTSTSTPAINVLEDEKAFHVEVAAPGMTKDDFKINIVDDALVISMEKKVNNENQNENQNENENKKDNRRYLRREFSYSKFQQTMTLPENAQKDAISAAMTDGILNITIPKMTAEEKEKAMKYIEIK